MNSVRFSIFDENVIAFCTNYAREKSYATFLEFPSRTEIVTIFSA